MKLLMFCFAVSVLFSCKVEENIVEDITVSDQGLSSLHDIWVLETIDGKPFKMAKNQKVPTIELFVSEKRFVGNDGCNNIFGQIIKLDEVSIEFSDISTTLMLCESMIVSDAFNVALVKTKKYQKNGLKLLFLDETGIELLGFKKVD